MKGYKCLGRSCIADEPLTNVNEGCSIAYQILLRIMVNEWLGHYNHDLSRPKIPETSLAQGFFHIASSLAHTAQNFGSSHQEP